MLGTQRFALLKRGHEVAFTVGAIAQQPQRRAHRQAVGEECFVAQAAQGVGRETAAHFQHHQFAVVGAAAQGEEVLVDIERRVDLESEAGEQACQSPIAVRLRRPR